MSFLIRILCARFVIKFLFLLTVWLSRFVCIILILIIVIIIPFPCIKIFKYLDTPLFFNIIIVHKLRMIKGYIGEGITNLVNSIHLIHELSGNFISLILVSDNPNTGTWRNSSDLSYPWEYMVIYNDCPLSTIAISFGCFILLDLLLFLDNSCWAYIAEYLIFITWWALRFSLMLWFLIFNAKLSLWEIKVLIFFITLYFLNKSHVYKLFNLFFLIICPIISIYNKFVIFFLLLYCIIILL